MLQYAQCPTIRFSSINLYEMLIELCDSHVNRYCIAAHSTLKGKLQFYFTNVITNDSIPREIEGIGIFAFALHSHVTFSRKKLSATFANLFLEAVNTVCREMTLLNF